MQHGHEGSELAADWRKQLMSEGDSFITETVFSHRSKVGLAADAKHAGYRAILVFIYVEADVAVERVAYRVAVDGGHDVPEQKIRQRHARLSALVAQAMPLVDRTEIFYNGAVGGIGHQRVGYVEDGKTHWTLQPPPEWAQRLVQDAGY